MSMAIEYGFSGMNAKFHVLRQGQIGRVGNKVANFHLVSVQVERWESFNQAVRRRLAGRVSVGKPFTVFHYGGEWQMHEDHVYAQIAIYQNGKFKDLEELPTFSKRLLEVARENAAKAQ